MLYSLILRLIHRVPYMYPLRNIAIFRPNLINLDRFGYVVVRNVRIQYRVLWYFTGTPRPSISTTLPRSILIRYVIYRPKLCVKIVFLVNDGLFEHFLTNKFVSIRETAEIRETWKYPNTILTYGNVLFRTCYRMYSYVKFNPFSLSYQKN